MSNYAEETGKHRFRIEDWNTMMQPTYHPGEREVRQRLGEEALKMLARQGWVIGWAIPPSEEIRLRNPYLFAYCAHCNWKWTYNANADDLEIGGEKYRSQVEAELRREINRTCSHIK